MKNPTKYNPQGCLKKWLLLATTAFIAGPTIAGPIPTPTHTAQNVAGDGTLAGGNFENTTVVTHLYLTSSNGWALGPPSTGIVREGQTFASSYPNLPGGETALFLQGGSSSATQTFSKTAGLWQLSFDGGQRNQNQTQIVRVVINGQNVFQDQIDAGALKRYTTRPFRHTGGNMTVQISGLQTTGDNTAIVDDVKLETVGGWNNAATWVGGDVPNLFADIVNIPPGVRVAFTENLNAKAGDIHVQGFLGVIDEAPSSIECRSILVNGSGATFQVGTEGSRHQSDFEVLLSTNDTARDIVNFGNKFIGAQMGGIIDLHGRNVTSYGKVNTTVSSENTIDVQNIAGWTIGDDIVITSTDGATNSTGANGWDNYETFTITNVATVNSTVTRLTLNGTIQRRHLGVEQSYSRALAPAKSWTFETRAYVGLLSRNVRVEGILPTGANTETGFGGHIMIMGAHNGLSVAGIGRLSNVELYHMGQKTLGNGGLVGRYPFHWHMLANAGTGQFIRNCSIHRSFNRAVTIHGTHNTSVSSNVAFDHLGHGIFLEDGSEENNTINNNLVVLSRKPAAGEEVILSDNSKNEPQNRSPSAFWISNPKNIINNNIASGTEGVGYWFALSDDPTGLSASDPRFNSITPRTNNITSFSGNSSNSSMMALDINDAVFPDTLDIFKNQAYNPTTDFQEINRLKVYGNNTGAYTGLGSLIDQLIFTENEYVENKFHTFLASYQTVSNSLFVDKTASAILTGTRTAVFQYDGPGRFKDNHFHGYNAADASVFQNGGGAVNRSNWLFEGSSFNHTGRPRVAYANTNVGSQMDATIDLDGTLTGVANRVLITPHPIMRTPTDPAAPANWVNAYVSNNTFISTITIMPGTDPLPSMTYTRVNTGDGTRVAITSAANDANHMAVLIANNPLYEYEISFGTFPVGKVVNFIIRDTTPGKTLKLKFMGLGGAKMGILTNGTAVTSMALLNSATTTSYFRDGSNLNVKIVATTNRMDTQQGTNVTWQ
jgi:cell surface hyaluronidase